MGGGRCLGGDGEGWGCALAPPLMTEAGLWLAVAMVTSLAAGLLPTPAEVLTALNGPLMLLESSARPAGCPGAPELSRGGMEEEEEAEEVGAAQLDAPDAAPD